jgi:hypothetical protein
MAMRLRRDVMSNHRGSGSYATGVEPGSASVIVAERTLGSQFAVGDANGGAQTLGEDSADLGTFDTFQPGHRPVGVQTDPDK